MDDKAKPQTPVFDYIMVPEEAMEGRIGADVALDVQVISFLDLVTDDVAAQRETDHRSICSTNKRERK